LNRTLFKKEIIEIIEKVNSGSTLSSDEMTLFLAYLLTNEENLKFFQKLNDEY